MDAGGDWRAQSQLHPEARSRIVNKITQGLMKCLPVSVPRAEELVELQRIAVRFEDKVYSAATSQSDYLRKISLKILSMEREANTQQNPVPGVTPARTDQSNIPIQEYRSNHEAMDAGGAWRAQSQLRPEARSKIVNKITQDLMKCLPVPMLGAEGLIELQRIAVQFEDNVYTAATSQSDYLRKISLKMLSMEREANTQQNHVPGSGSEGKNQKKLRCYFRKKGGHFKKDCLKKEKRFERKGVAYDPTHKRTKAGEKKK